MRMFPHTYREKCSPTASTKNIDDHGVAEATSVLQLRYRSSIAELINRLEKQSGEMREAAKEDGRSSRGL